MAVGENGPAALQDGQVDVIGGASNRQAVRPSRAVNSAWACSRTTAAGSPRAVSSATRWTRCIWSWEATASRRARRAFAATVPTRRPMGRSNKVVMRSAEESMVNDRYGRVWKKSKANTELRAATAPAVRPPVRAAARTTSTRARATLVLPTRRGPRPGRRPRRSVRGRRARDRRRRGPCPRVAHGCHGWSQVGCTPRPGPGEPPLRVLYGAAPDLNAFSNAMRRRRRQQPRRRQRMRCGGSVGTKARFRLIRPCWGRSSGGRATFAPG